MTVPTDFDSFAYGFNLTAANYSGGAGGTFANLVSGGEDWTVDGATPSFATEAGMEGMTFSNSAAESILGEHRALYECTVLAIARPTAATNYIYGGNKASANTFMLRSAANLVSAGSDGYALNSGTAGTIAGVPEVFVATFSPMEGKIYCQLNDGTPTVGQASAGFYDKAAVDYFNAAIGRARTTYFTGWIGRVLVFSRALHYRDNTNLQSLVATEMASIGL